MSTGRSCPVTHHQQRPQLIARGALELKRLFRLGHASRQGGQGLHLLMDQSLNAGYPQQGNIITGGSSLQPKAIFSQHFRQLRNECFHPERGYLSSLRGLTCGFTVWGDPGFFQCVDLLSPKCCMVTKTYPHICILRERAEGGHASLPSIFSPSSFHLDKILRLYILFH